MQQARCYLLGEQAVVLELDPPVSLQSRQRIWELTQRLRNYEQVVEVITGMNNITLLLRDQQQSALDAIEQLQRWWEESEAHEVASRRVDIPVI
ncbi:carboxyltransferase domain-containing protein [Candidatus Pantoea persica]|uniref:carboxyltransferase domain-containing protein n=1 Tax=Candidatus Pantoea persica TaxID=2518128 RepID=UPI0035A94BA1|nr:metal-binding protein [Candidatus Pantoea persica]